MISTAWGSAVSAGCSFDRGEESASFRSLPVLVRRPPAPVALDGPTAASRRSVRLRRELRFVVRNDVVAIDFFAIVALLG